MSGNQQKCKTKIISPLTKFPCLTGRGSRTGSKVSRTGSRVSRRTGSKVACTALLAVFAVICTGVTVSIIAIAGSVVNITVAAVSKVGHN
jgi:hypothetical protein